MWERQRFVQLNIPVPTLKNAHLGHPNGAVLSCILMFYIHVGSSIRYESRGILFISCQTRMGWNIVARSVIHHYMVASLGRAVEKSEEHLRNSSVIVAIDHRVVPRVNPYLSSFCTIVCHLSKTCRRWKLPDLFCAPPLPSEALNTSKPAPNSHSIATQVQPQMRDGNKESSCPNPGSIPSRHKILWLSALPT